MGLKYVEEEMEIPLYNELEPSKHESDNRITIGLDLKTNHISRRTVNEDVDETIYLDVPTYVRG